MEIVDIKKDNFTNEVVVRFKGEFDEHTAIESVKDIYPSVHGEITEYHLPTEFMGCVIPGIVFIS